MEHAFGREAAFQLGMEEELLLLDAETHALAPVSSRVLEGLHPPEGAVMHDVYEALVECASPVSGDAIAGAQSLQALRVHLREAGATLAGAGIHPDGAFGDAPHVEHPRYREIGDQMRGLLRRTPTCALHVHVGMPDPETAILACNRMRVHLPVLQALAAHSPYWHGRDSGFQTARAQLFRGYPRADIPRAFAGWEDYSATMAQIVQAAAVKDYTYLWWDIRPHPKLGTLELRAMDGQARIGAVCGLSALVHGLVLASLEDPPAGKPAPREVLVEASYRAGRDGLDATVWDGGEMHPVRDLAATAIERARPHARALGVDGARAEVERILREGNGADRMRAAHGAGGMAAVLERLVAETAEPL